MKYLYIILFSCLHLISKAQSPINGSGKMIKKKVAVEMFSELEISFPAHIEVNCQTHPNLELTVDDNMFSQIDIVNRGNKLIIRAKRWGQPSENCKIIIGTPFLNRLKTGSYSDYSVFNIETNDFHLENEVANVHLAGKTGALTIDNGTGTVDALNLTTNDAEVSTWDWSMVKVSADNSLIANTTGDGYILYDQLPNDVRTNLGGGGHFMHVDDYVDPHIGIETEYIDFKVINNGTKKKDIYIIGPPWQTFSYGAPLEKGQIKDVHLPIGTRVYDTQGKRPRLIGTVNAGHADQLVKLFEEGEWN